MNTRTHTVGPRQIKQRYHSVGLKKSGFRTIQGQGIGEVVMRGGTKVLEGFAQNGLSIGGLQVQQAQRQFGIRIGGYGNSLHIPAGIAQVQRQPLGHQLKDGVGRVEAEPQRSGLCSPKLA